jgi:cell division protein FtsQ
MALFGMLLGYLLMAGPPRALQGMLALREVQFQGNRHLEREELLELLALKPGEPLWRISSSELRRRLLASPWIREASIRKTLQGRLVVRLRERSPFALYSDGGALWLIDRKGRRLERIRGQAPPLLPVIEAQDSDGPVFLEALALVEALKARGLHQKEPIRVLAQGRPKDLAFLYGPVLVRVGQGEYPLKIERFLALEAEVRRLRAESVDLRFANQMVVRPVAELKR